MLSKEYFRLKGRFSLNSAQSDVTAIRRLILQLSIILFFLSPITFAAERIESLSVFNGLSNPQVYAIAKDQQGFMWFGTADGVKRFNGYEFLTLRNDPLDAESLSNNSVGVMLIDSSDRIWVGTWGGGVNRYNRDTQSFTRYLHNPEEADSLSADRVQAIYESRSGDIWVGTNGGGLNRYLEESDSFQSWLHQPEDASSISHNRVWSIAEDNSGKLWIGTSNGLNRFNPDSNEFDVYRAGEQSLDHQEVRVVHVDHRQRIWVATRQSFGLFEPQTGHYQTFELPDVELPSVTSIRQVQNSLLLATFAGIYKFDLINKRFVPAGTNGEWGLLDNRDVRQVMQDATGIVWAATRYSGVLKVYQNPPPFNGWRNFLQQYQLSGLFNQVVALHPGEGKQIWLGTGRSLVRFDGEGQFTPHMNEDSLRNLNRLRILHISQSAEGKIWLATDNGLYWLSEDKSRIERLEIPWLNSNRQALDWVSVDDTGKLWLIAAGENRIARWQPGETDAQFFVEGTDPAFVFLDDQNHAWVGTSGDGLFQIERASGKVRQFRQHDAVGPSDDVINDALQDKSGHLWIATGKGVDRFFPDENRFEHFAIKRENTDIAVQSMVLDQQEQLWLATNQGLFRLEPETHTLHHFTTNDGLHSNNFLARSALMAKDGTIYFGSIDGLTGFHPERVTVNRVAPPVVITKLQVDGNTVAKIPEILEVPFNYRNIQLGFAALDFQATEDNRYQTRVLGFTDDWSLVSPIPEMTIGRLEPGEYQFQVKGSNNHGVWNEAPAQLTLIVAPAWYQTLWFRISLGSLLLAILALGYWIKVRQHARIRQYLSAKVEQRTKDILVLGDVGRDIANTFDAYTIAERIFDKLRPGISADTYGFALLDEQADRLNFIYVSRTNQENSEQQFSLEDASSPSVWSVLQGKALNLQTELEWQASAVNKTLCLNGAETQSVVCEPLISKDGVLGIITLQSNTEKAFDTSHLSMLRVVASHAAVALQNTIAFKELAEAEERLELAMEGANAGMWEWDLHNYKLITSPIWAAMLDYEPEELVTRFGDSPQKFEQLLHPEDRTQATQLLNDHIAGNSDTYRAEFRMLNAKGQWQWILSVGQAVREGEQNSASKVFGIHLDVSDAKALQGALHDAKEKAEQATQAKSDFLSNMSHEIRTPMNAIIGMSHLALQTQLNRKQHNYISKVHTSAEALLRIINDILDFSKIEAGKMDIEHVPFSLENVLDNMASITGFKALEKRIEVYFDIAPDVPNDLVGDPLRLGQILLNLVNNAVKFTDTGGDVLLKIAKQENLQDKVLLRFEVQDTGIGMTQEQTGRLFQSFSQADSTITRKYGGTGLGLAICKDLVELMGGEIWVTSEPGIGSVFSFTLLCEAAQTQQGEPTLPLQGKNLMVIDDKPQFLTVVSKMLTQWGAKALLVSNLSEAQKIMENEPDTLDLALLDWDLEGETPAQLSDALIKIPGNNTAVKWLALLNQGQDEPTASNGLQVVASLHKPLLPKQFLHTLESALLGSAATGSHLQTKQSSSSGISNLAGAEVLLVEDNALNQELAMELLAQKSVKVTLAENGQEALALLQTRTFDAVLMDCQMPVMDGYTATQKIRTDLALTLPVIAMTANAMAEDKERVLAVGMDDHIAKPIAPEQLYSTLSRWLKDTDVAANQENLEIAADTQINELPASVDSSLLDTNRGLTTCAGNQKLYQRLLSGFVQQHADFVQAIQASLTAGNSDEAIRLAHTLKGNAGNIGALALFELSGQLESLLLSKSEDYKALLSEIEALLPRLESEIRDALQQFNSEAPFVQTSEQDEIAESLPALFAQLHQQLEESDTAAEDTLEILCKLLPEHQELLNNALHALDEFDFERAQTLLTEASLL